MIRDLLLVQRGGYAREVITKAFTFHKPYQRVDNAVSSPPGYWISPEHDVIKPGVSNRHLESPIIPSPKSAFPWGLVRNIHLSMMRRSHAQSTTYKELIDRLPNLQHVCILYAFDDHKPRTRNHTRIHVTTMESLVQVEERLQFKNQGSLGVEPYTSEPMDQDNNYHGNVTEINMNNNSQVIFPQDLQWNRTQGIGIVEFNNSCPHCPINHVGRLDWQRQAAFGDSQSRPQLI
ncbi:hypothetical protein F4859DRAFT_517987 [Xylaria cf. heliscus]|nr:hypothetical protein F4859DRAFT_517987 [Xylaria cf. heliscus]